MTAVAAPPEALRIAMFSESYLPRTSGVVHSVAAFASALRARGHRVVVAAPRIRGYRDADPDVIRYPSIPTREPDFALGLWWAPAAERAVEAAAPDVVHTHGPFLMGRAAARVARRRGAPLVFTHHTLYDEYVHYVPGPRWMWRPLVRRYVARYANRCACVLAPSAALASRLRAQGVRCRVEILPTGAVDPDLLASLDPRWVRPTFGIPAGQPLLVTASRLAPEKSVDLVLRAFGRVAARRDAVLLVIGGGPEETALRRLAGRLGVAGRVVFAGRQPHRRTLECMAAADAFIFGSQTETQGLVLVEALACGCPVVAVDAGGVGDVVTDGETGYLVPASADALARRVLEILDDPARRAALAARGKEVSRQFALPVLAARLEQIYWSVLPVRRT
ncbi:MAG: glycosyltransferase [Armatimonadota bacterium]|nr:glycosyltransferase [Armatimonadota bacterium]MDR7402640.1 glycosyltransferase [Armatimonadota bacterium]MDR7436758.1 glycosyltransferase [Armatimonadota bacterium]MDR7472705.1 glycosyltransferase [Armatimonadota bacterium]MDR7507004.1 glycosyltransferase [Armatimonadota bacterium]